MAEQAFVPMIAYEDAGRAAEWLVRAFDFRERERFKSTTGVVTDVVLEYGDSFFIAGHPSDAYLGPRRHAAACDAARAWLDTPYVVDGMLVYVDDLDAHHARARASGAKILTPIEENSLQRQYRCEDLEGHRWMFATRLKR